MATIELILAVLKSINLLLGFLDCEKMRQAGRDEVIAETLIAIGDKLGVRKVIQGKIDAMSDVEVDDVLRNRGK